MQKLIIGIILILGSLCHADIICEIDGDIEYSTLVSNDVGHAIAGWVREKDDVYYAEAVSSRDGGKSWSSPILFSDKLDLFRAQSIALDAASGYVLVAWVEKYDETYPWEYSLMLCRSKDGGMTWEQPKCIAKTSMNIYGNDKPSLTLLPSGQALIGWYTDKCIEFLCSSDFGGTWRSEKLGQERWSSEHSNLSDTDNSYKIKSDPYLFMLENGKAIAAWSFNPKDKEHFLIIASSKDFGKSWEITHSIELDDYIYEASFHMNSSGNILLLWETYRSSTCYMAYSHDGGVAWSRPADIGRYGPMETLSLNDKNQAFFASIELDEATLGENLTAHTSSNGGVDWNSQYILDLGESWADRINIASLNSGQLILAWSQASGRKRETHTAVSSDYGVTWSLGGPIVAKPSQYLTEPRVVLNSAGQAIITWERTYLKKTTIESAYSSDFGHTWN